MPIYDKPVWHLMHDMVKDLGISRGELISRDRIIDWFATRYPRIRQGTVTAHLIRQSTNAPSRVHHGLRPGDDDLFFQVDGGHFRLYEPDRDPAPITKTSKQQVPASASLQEEPEEPTEFAYEADLRNFLARNLGLLERGLKLYEEEGITGVEFPVGGRAADILAVDSSQNYVVIELKVSRGYDRVVGQLLRYMGWISNNHANPGQEVRGFIVAREITEDLQLACAGLSNVSLFEYELSVSVRPVLRSSRAI